MTVKPTDLEMIVERSVGQILRVHLVFGFVSMPIALLMAIVYGVWWPLLAIPAALFCTFHISIFICAKLLPYMIPVQLIASDFRAAKLRQLNQRLDEGLQHGEELDRLMEEAGLEPLHVQVDQGPVIGKLGDVELYEWVDATQGSDEVLRYEYVGRGRIDENRCLIVPNDGRKYLCFNGILYART